MIDLIYAAWFNNKLMNRYIKKLLPNLQQVGLPIRLVNNTRYLNFDNYPNIAPYSLTKNIYEELSCIDKTNLYHWKEIGVVNGRNGDILIGHPSFIDNNNGIWERSVLYGKHKVKIAMFPMSHRMVEHCWYIEPYLERIDKIFGIMGPYWYDTWDKCALAHWKPKIIPFDMAIDPEKFPFVKRSFNAPGKRKFFYIGRNCPQKGTHLLSILFGLVKDIKCISIGSEKIPNIDYRPYAVFTPNYLAKLAEECDFFITMGVSDANPTTILESMSWGFPVCCTPQSGYYNIPDINELDINDMKKNIEVIERLQYTPESELIELTHRARRLVETKYNWSVFREKLRISISEFL